MQMHQSIGLAMMFPETNTRSLPSALLYYCGEFETFWVIPNHITHLPISYSTGPILHLFNAALTYSAIHTSLSIPSSIFLCSFFIHNLSQPHNHIFSYSVLRYSGKHLKISVLILISDILKTADAVRKAARRYAKLKCGWTCSEVK